MPKKKERKKPREKKERKKVPREFPTTLIGSVLIGALLITMVLVGGRTSPSKLKVIMVPTSATLERYEELNIFVQVTGGKSPYSYSWYINGIEIYEGSNNYVYSRDTGGTDLVKCEVTDYLGSLASGICAVTVNGEPPPFIITYLETWSGYPIAADQGLALSDDGQYLFCTGSMGLRKIRVSDREVMGEVSTFEPDASHNGDCGYLNGYVFVPLTNWRASTPTTVRYLKIYDDNLNLIHRFYLSLLDWEGEAASIDYDEISGFWWIGDYNTPYVHCYNIDPVAGTCQFIQSRFIGINTVQGITWLKGKMYIQCGSERNVYQFVNFVNRGSQFCGGFEGLEALGDKIYVGERHFGVLPDAPIRVYKITSGM